MRKLYARAICPNCKKIHDRAGNNNRPEKRCKCGYWISYEDYKGYIYK